MIFQGLIDKSIEDNQLLGVLSKIFNISTQKIFITEDIYALDIKLKEDTEILCEKTNIKGDFICKITIYLRSQHLKEKQLIEENVFFEFCNLIDCRCLISDDSHNPYTMILLPPNDKKNVVLNPDDLDNDIYTIQKQ